MGKGSLSLGLAAVAALLLGAGDAPDGGGAGGGDYNGFELEDLTVSPDTIRVGAERDAIHAVDLPEFVSPEAAEWVAPHNPVLGVQLGGEARVYPLHLMEYHQVVNDLLGEVPVAVTYDPLAGAPIAFKRRIEGRALRFGVSGLVYNSAALLYDHETESLWSPLEGEAIAGELAGTEIERVVIRQETLIQWLQRAPESLVLTRPEPRRIDYRYSPFSRYWVQDEIPYPVEAKDRRFHAKEVVLGLVEDGDPRAYLGSSLTAAGGRITDELEGHEVRIDYDTDNAVFHWEAPEEVQVTEAYWFAWKAFHPDTGIWNEPDEPAAGKGGEGDPDGGDPDEDEPDEDETGENESREGEPAASSDRDGD